MDQRRWQHVRLSDLLRRSPRSRRIILLDVVPPRMSSGVLYAIDGSGAASFFYRASLAELLVDALREAAEADSLPELSVETDRYNPRTVAAAAPAGRRPVAEVARIAEEAPPGELVLVREKVRVYKSDFGSYIVVFTEAGGQVGMNPVAAGVLSTAAAEALASSGEEADAVLVLARNVRRIIADGVDPNAPIPDLIAGGYMAARVLVPVPGGSTRSAGGPEGHASGEAPAGQGGGGGRPPARPGPQAGGEGVEELARVVAEQLRDLRREALGGEDE